MQLSTKLGFTGIGMLLITGVLALYAPHGPIAFVTSFLACALGASAAERGTKWWLAIPGSLAAVFVIVLFMAFRAI